MKNLRYIFHDCFVYDDGENLMVFDFWTDPDSDNPNIPDFIKDADKKRHLIVFVSHHHKDHFSRHIFEWEQFFRKTTFILSYDTAKFCRHILRPDSIYAGYKPEVRNVKVLNPGMSVSLDNVFIKAYGSTDIGNSYLIKTQGETLFHAGDLNAWIWKDESTEEEVDIEIKKFEKIVDEIVLENPKIGIVMFPVDARIGRDFFTGAKIFLKKIMVDRFLPMHFSLGDSLEKDRLFKKSARDFINYANTERGEYIFLSSPYSGIAW